MVPHVTGRPLTLVHCPQGLGGGCRYMKHSKVCGLARALERHDPQRYSTRFAKAGRERKILVDYLRNNRTNTSVAAFSPRARPGLPVSVPVAGDELDPARPPRHTCATTPQRLARLRQDPWSGYGGVRQRLTPELLAAVGAAPAGPAGSARRERF